MMQFSLPGRPTRSLGKVTASSCSFSQRREWNSTPLSRCSAPQRTELRAENSGPSKVWHSHLRREKLVRCPGLSPLQGLFPSALSNDATGLSDHIPCLEKELEQPTLGRKTKRQSEQKGEEELKMSTLPSLTEQVGDVLNREGSLSEVKAV